MDNMTLKKRDMISPLEGAQREAENQDGSEDGEPETDQKTDNLANSSTGSHQQADTGGDKFQAMEDGYGDGQTYYYDEDLTRTGENPNAEMRHRTTSDADLIFRSSRDADQSRANTLFRYGIVAIIALSLGILLGVLINMAATAPYLCSNATNGTNT